MQSFHAELLAADRRRSSRVVQCLWQVWRCCCGMRMLLRRNPGFWEIEMVVYEVPGKFPHVTAAL